MVCENLMVSMNENSNHEPKPTVTILGCGIMGSGIAQVFLSSGYFVNLYGRSETSCMSAVKKIESSLSRSLIRKNKESGNKLSDQVLISLLNEQMQRIRQFTQISSAVGSANFIIESVVEDLKTKLDLFDEVQKYCRRDAIILTNTSSIRLSDLLPVIANPENFGGLHFFNPVPAMKLVEIAVTSQTSNKVVEILENLCLDIGKKSVRCRDTDGFIVNRLLVPFLVDAIRMLERGDARKEDIDAAMKFGASHPMGPLELCDYVGLDTLKSIIEIITSKLRSIVKNTTDANGNFVLAGHDTTLFQFTPILRVYKDCQNVITDIKLNVAKSSVTSGKYPHTYNVGIINMDNSDKSIAASAVPITTLIGVDVRHEVEVGDPHPEVVHTKLIATVPVLVHRGGETLNWRVNCLALLSTVNEGRTSPPVLDEKLLLFAEFAPAELWDF
ncbi:hypothetical protein WR25_22807 [Diploscapter pachys]|uniref:3-hydroxyacyl-CoA dehydrogenase n=1 Tax=Diploscapter pachys TaxID=2018661 RepID=A0A2A2JK01_9BILA|nr:hypothetical protein WR25_22807 [Diploscapter pachys]